MDLSNRAEKYLNEIKRAKKWIITNKEAEEYLKNNSIENEKISEIACLYSGYHFKVGNRKGLFINLFSKSDIKNKTKPFIEFNDDRYFFFLGYDSYAPFTYYISDLGEISTSTSREEIISSSIEKYIEFMAYEDMLERYMSSCSYRVLDEKKLNVYMRKYYSKIEECCDEYSYWGQGQYGKINKGTWLGGGGFYCRVFSKTQKNIDYIISKLQAEKIIQ